MRAVFPSERRLFSLVLFTSLNLSFLVFCFPFFPARTHTTHADTHQRAARYGNKAATFPAHNYCDYRRAVPTVRSTLARSGARTNEARRDVPRNYQGKELRAALYQFNQERMTDECHAISCALCRTYPTDVPVRLPADTCDKVAPNFQVHATSLHPTLLRYLI